MPAGSFVVFAKMVISSFVGANGHVGCNLIAGGAGDQAVTSWAKPSSEALASGQLGDTPRAIALNVVHTFTLPSEVLLQCWVDTVTDDGTRLNGAVKQIKITAIRVGKLTNQRLEIVD